MPYYRCASVIIFAAATLFLLVDTKPVRADNDKITVYADESRTSCFLMDTGSALFTLYIVHENSNGVIADFLSVTESAGFTATFVAENIPSYHVGTFHDGVTVIYDECIVSAGPFLVGTITYQGNGTSEPCSRVDIAGNPHWGPFSDAWTEDCSYYDYPAPSLGPLYVNPTPECPPRCAVRSEASTWGRVKALYRR